MTIEKGTPWGEVVPIVNHLPTFDSLAEMGRWLSALLLSQDTIAAGSGIEICTTARNFRNMLGLTNKERHDRIKIPIDLFLVEATLVSGTKRFIAIDFVRISGGLLRGEIIHITNTGFWGGKHIATRAHPNDGFLDIVRVDQRMSLLQRFHALRRLKWGTHIPHQHLSVTQDSSFSWMGSAQTVVIDSARHRKVVGLHVSVMPDAVTLYV